MKRKGVLKDNILQARNRGLIDKVQVFKALNSIDNATLMGDLNRDAIEWTKENKFEEKMKDFAEKNPKKLDPINTKKPCNQ